MKPKCAWGVYEAAEADRLWEKGSIHVRTRKQMNVDFAWCDVDFTFTSLRLRRLFAETSPWSIVDLTSNTQQLNRGLISIRFDLLLPLCDVFTSVLGLHFVASFGFTLLSLRFHITCTSNSRHVSCGLTSTSLWCDFDGACGLDEIHFNFAPDSIRLQFLYHVGFASSAFRSLSYPLFPISFFLSLSLSRALACKTDGLRSS